MPARNQLKRGHAFVRRAKTSSVLVVGVLCGSPLYAQSNAPSSVTTPLEHFGHEIGADHVLPNYAQLSAYWQRLARESGRMVLDTIGRTAEGRVQLMAIVTSPENHARLDHYRDIARRLALAQDLTEPEARGLAREGRAVVWIDGSLHASEILPAQALMETVFRLVSRDDPETLRILDDVIFLAVHANPDGHDLVADWYMRDPKGIADRRVLQRTLPVLTQKYIGTNINRDFFAVTQPETRNMSRVLYHEWFPQIVYNPHQNAPPGTVIWVPPYDEPHNIHIDPLIVSSAEIIGSAMKNRFIAEGKPGVVTRAGGRNFNMWWNGGLRTTPYFHNMIGIMTESIGHPTPIEVPFVITRQQPWGDLHWPIEPQAWHFRQAVDYSVTAHFAVLDIASRLREQWLFNIYRMGSNAIDRGGRDSWTAYPSRMRAARDLAGTETLDPAEYERLLRPSLRRPELRDPRGYIIPSNQRDFLTATKFVDALRASGVVVKRAARDFEVGGKRYPAGSFVVKTAQAFGPHVLDLFEPQDFPDETPHPRAEPAGAYDMAGWTLAFQMGVGFDRILDGFEGPFETIEEPAIRPAPGRLPDGAPVGYLLSHQLNDAFLAANRVLGAGGEVFQLSEPYSAGDRVHPAGTFFIPASDTVRPVLERLARESGLTFEGAASIPEGEHRGLSPARIGLWDEYGGQNQSGAVRWVLDHLEFPYEVVYPQRLDAGDLEQSFDIIILPRDAVRASGTVSEHPYRELIPEEFHYRLGAISADRTIPQLRSFLEAGGTIAAISTSARNLARHLGLPLRDHLVERRADGTERRLPRSEFEQGRSIYRGRVDATAPVAQGAPEQVDFVLHNNSPVFREPDHPGIRKVAWFDSREPLRSGWAHGQHYLQGGVIIAEVEVGAGSLYLFGPEITYRAQPHGTFRFLANAIVSAAAEASPIQPTVATRR